MAVLHTTLGEKTSEELGLILPHEHLFVDLRLPDTPGFAQAEEYDVLAMMVPEVQRAQSVGVTALVECSPVGVGRRVDMDLAISRACALPVIVPTGIYREPWVPRWAHAASGEALSEWMLGELTQGVEETGVLAAWIKLSANDDGITSVEEKILRAAANAGKETNAVIGSHTIRGRVVKDQLAILEDEGYSAERCIWIHTQAEPDFNLHLEMAERGVWLEYDALGRPDAPSDETVIAWIQTLFDRGHTRILLSHDRGWYDPGTPNRVPEPFTYLSEHFIPKLRDAGFDEPTIRMLTHENPFTAYAR